MGIRNVLTSFLSSCVSSLPYAYLPLGKYTGGVEERFPGLVFYMTMVAMSEKSAAYKERSARNGKMGKTYF